MLNKKKTILLAATLLVGMLAFIGCGKSNSDGNSNPTTEVNKRTSYEAVIDMYYKAYQEENVEELVDISCPEEWYSKEEMNTIKKSLKFDFESLHASNDTENQKYYTEFKNIVISEAEELSEEVINEFIANNSSMLDDPTKMVMDSAYEVTVELERYNYFFKEWEKETYIDIFYKINGEWYMFKYYSY